jgi:hypothetical protein
MRERPRPPNARPPSDAAVPHAGRTGRCLLLTQRGEPAPTLLANRLAERQLAIETFTDASALMAALAGGATLAVVVLQPCRQPRLGELLRALQRYYPGVVCWQYEAGPGLQRIETTPNSGQAGVVEKDRPFGSEQRNGMFGTPRNRQPLEPRNQQPAGAETAPLLTQEELDMLLGSMEDLPAGGGAGGGGDVG